jgi:hypothetical protein
VNRPPERKDPVQNWRIAQPLVPLHRYKNDIFVVWVVLLPPQAAETPEIAQAMDSGEESRAHAVRWVIVVKCSGSENT